MRTFLFLVLLASSASAPMSGSSMNYAAPGPARTQRDGRPHRARRQASPPSRRSLPSGRRRATRMLFQLGVRAARQAGALKAGEYAIPAHAPAWPTSPASSISGKSIQHKITAAEGLTSQMIYELVKNDPVLDGDAGPVPAGRHAAARDLSLHARHDARGDARAHARGAAEIRRRAMGRARARPAVHDAGAGADPGLHRGEGNRAFPKSAATSRRCSSTACGSA